jgi:hypothetical protein
VSYKNNYEIVEFVAPATTTYRIDIKKQSASESTNSLGIAWSKQASYLPDVRNSGGWASTIYVRNDGALARPVKVTFLNTDGSFTVGNEANTTLNANAQWSPPPPSGWSGSAVVDGSEDLSVVAATQQNSSGKASLDNAYRSSGNDGAFEQTATLLFAPAFYTKDL